MAQQVAAVAWVAAVVGVQSLAQELLHALGAAKKKKKKSRDAQSQDSSVNSHNMGCTPVSFLYGPWQVTLSLLLLEWLFTSRHGIWPHEG